MKNLELFPVESLDAEQARRLADTLVNLGQIHDINGRLAQANLCYRKALEVDPRVAYRTLQAGQPMREAMRGAS